jgi:hypothetical protein
MKPLESWRLGREWSVNWMFRALNGFDEADLLSSLGFASKCLNILWDCVRQFMASCSLSLSSSRTPSLLSSRAWLKEFIPGIDFKNLEKPERERESSVCLQAFL